jgi:hypothetical protein
MSATPAESHPVVITRSAWPHRIARTCRRHCGACRAGDEPFAVHRHGPSATRHKRYPAMPRAASLAAWPSLLSCHAAVGLARQSTPVRATLSRMASEPRVVWVLGAGFSKPLGGPLLGQLLSPGSVQDLQERFGRGRLPVSDAARCACHVYHYGRKYAEGSLLPDPIAGETLWEDAEDFIARLDSSESIAGARYTLQRICTTLRRLIPASWPQKEPSLEDMREGARRLVAADCSLFAEDAKLIHEPWSAHIDWARHLDKRHTIVTFNYDRVPERLRGYIKHEHRTTNLAVLLPSEDPNSQQLSAQARVLKLHGSVDWRRTEEGVVRAADDFALTASGKDMVIATPGPTKTEVTALLEPLWLLAHKEIEAADPIVFVGYRFPPTDAIAKKRLLEAIESAATQRRNAEGLLHVHIVLGPRNPDAPRLIELLRRALQRGGLKEYDELRGIFAPGGYYRIYEHQLYAEDFFIGHSDALLIPDP